MPSSSNAATFDFELYRYDLSLPAAIISVVVFTALTATHIWRISGHQTYYFVPFVVGGIFEVIGYSGRIWSHFDKTSVAAFILQAVPILVAPALFAASIYMILGRLISTTHGDRLSPVPLRWLTKVFVCGDMLSFTVQAAGGGVQSGGSLDLYNLGERIIVAGLFLQIAFFGMFLTVAILFHARAVTAAKHEELDKHCPWQRHMAILYTTSALIMVRSIVRVTEYLGGNDGYLISHEVFLYVFDMALMSLVMLILAVWYIDDLRSYKQQEKSGWETHIRS